MSIIVTAKLNKGSHEIGSAKRRDRDLWRNVAHAARESGCLDHKVIANDHEALLVEEWSDTNEFEAFFDGTPAYRQAIDEVGFRGFPGEIDLWHLA